MNALDIAVIAVVVLSGLFAFARGFVKETLSIGAWLGAAFAALYALPFAVPAAEHFLPKGAVAQAAAAIVVFILALIVLSILTSALSRRVKDSALSAVDRTLGLVFGLVRGVVLMCLAYMALAWLLPAGEQQPAWLAQARTLPLLASGADRLRELVPASLRERAATTAVRTQDSIEKEARKQIQKEAEGAIRAYSNPKGSAGGAQPGSQGYKPEERRDLNRLIEQNSR